MATDPNAQPFSVTDFLYRTTDGSKWEIPDAETFDFAGFFDWMADCRQLLLRRDELTWMEKQKAPDRSVDVFVNMSCGTQLAPHVTLDIVGVLRALDVDFVAGAGRQFCCGKIYRTRTRVPAGEKMSQSSIDRFTGWGARTAVHGCHSCQIVYSDYVDRVESAAGPGFRNAHLSTFLEERLRELGDRVPWKHEVRRRVLVEGHGPEVSPVHDAATKASARILAMVPGVEVVGVVEPPSVGAPCKTRVPGGPSVLSTLDGAERHQVLDEIEDQARRRGADTISSNAHYCHREWSKWATTGVDVTYYVSILAEALGCANEDRYQRYWKLGDPAKVVEETRPYWTSWGLDEAKALEVARKNFEPHFAGYVNPQCACGGDPTKCNTGKYTLAKDIPTLAADRAGVAHEF